MSYSTIRTTLLDLQWKWRKNHGKKMPRNKKIEYRDLEWLEDHHETIGAEIKTPAQEDDTTLYLVMTEDERFHLFDDAVITIGEVVDETVSEEYVFFDEETFLIWAYRRLEVASYDKNKDRFSHAEEIIKTLIEEIEEMKS